MEPWGRCVVMHVASNLMDKAINYIPHGNLVFGCNNLVSYKVATRLKIPWICNTFHIVATLHLLITLK